MGDFRGWDVRGRGWYFLHGMIAMIGMMDRVLEYRTGELPEIQEGVAFD